jgi:hypothetical protein
MMIYQEKIAPPLAPMSDEEQITLLVEAITKEDRWIDDFIVRLAGAIRDLKH